MRTRTSRPRAHMREVGESGWHAAGAGKHLGPTKWSAAALHPQCLPHNPHTRSCRRAQLKRPRHEVKASAVKACRSEGGGTRTHDLGIKSPLLYQLSYAPVPYIKLFLYSNLAD